ncbi:hypothetical protein ElyMa_004674000 [Elysia marginata]|uniref:Uncharacterized protein n=1 Tax=Elysia marginata TaxID=1093978 RepID=A0AAV4I7S7_9GAST|nr:hypothetical protein ElyMa_004674000 [Elysia marginata]
MTRSPQLCLVAMFCTALPSLTKSIQGIESMPYDPHLVTSLSLINGNGFLGVLGIAQDVELSRSNKSSEDSKPTEMTAQIQAMKPGTVKTVGDKEILTALRIFPQAVIAIDDPQHSSKEIQLKSRQRKVRHHRRKATRSSRPKRRHRINENKRKYIVEIAIPSQERTKKFQHMFVG